MKRTAIIIAVSVLAMTACRQGDTHLSRDFSEFDQSLVDSVFNYTGLEKMTDELQSLIVVKDGRIVAEKYAPEYGPDHLFILWSGSKTFNAAAVGFAQQEGLLNVDDPVLKYLDGYEVNPETADRWARVTIRHLLCMGSGLVYDPSAELKTHLMKDGVRNILAARIEWEPGTQFKYNSMNSYLLSAIVTKVTGEKVVDYLTPRLFEPLGIRKYIWTESAEGLNFGGWGLYLTTESFAKMGQFYLQKGVWEGKRLLEESWFDEAMSPQIIQHQHLITPENAADWEEYAKGNEGCQGYGFQMWCCTHGAYRLDGAWGQISMIIPDKNAVVTVNGHSSHPKEILMAAIWKYIYPAL